jgi:hypothetical protein
MARTRAINITACHLLIFATVCCHWLQVITKTVKGLEELHLDYP